MSASATDSRPHTREDRLPRHQRIVDRYVGGDPIAEIAADEGVCVKTVRNVARRNDIPCRRRDRRVRDARIATRYAAGEKVALIASAEGVSRSYVRAAAKRAGLPPRVGWQRRYPIDETAFDEPTATGWWLVGLLASDGCIYAPEHRISLAQRSSDADVLRAFLTYVGAPERPLTDLTLSPAAAARAWPGAPAQEARVFSGRLCRALAQHGVVPRKSKSMVLSTRAASEAAVWLGMFDGDGSGGPQRNHGRPRINWYGSRRVMERCTAFWAVTLSLDPGPAVLGHAGGLSTVALHGRTAARAAQVMLDASPVSHQRKRLVLEEIANYRPLGRRVRPRV